MDANGLRFWMLSRREDWLPPWRAGAPYFVGQGVVDPNGNLQVVQVGGKSGGGQPAWATVMGQTTTDGTVTWIHSGPGTWQSSSTYLPGQYILDSNGNLQMVSASSGGGRSGTTPPVWPTAYDQTVADGDLTWAFKGPPQDGLFYCAKTHRLQLRSMRTGSMPAEDFTKASSLLEAPPMTRDEFGNYARWDEASGHVVAGGSGPSSAPQPDEVPIYTPPAGAAVTDLALGYDGVLYLAVGGSLVLVDRRNRWPNFTLSDPNLKFWRLAPLLEGGVLALDRDTPQLGKVAGLPLPTGPANKPNPGILRSCEQNPNPPRIVSRFPLPSLEYFVALAPMDQGRFALLSWEANNAANPRAYVRSFSEAAGVGNRMQLASARFPYSLAWLGEQRIAVLVTNLKEALIFDLQEAGNALVAAGETYSLADTDLGPFVHGFDLPPYYAKGGGMLPLVPLSLNSFAGSGATAAVAPIVLDSGAAQTVWHRMFLEAVIPPRCGALVWMAASDSLGDFADPKTSWYPHIFGAADTSSIPGEVLPDVPQAVWQSMASEVAFGPAMLGGERIEGRQGLFMVLVQRAHKAVRSLRGRFLGIRVQLNGDRRSTPEIAALRVYASRFSYVEHYLPELYREDTFGPEADQDGASTRPDFFERFVDLFESELTRTEDHIANAYLLTRPESSPDDSLGWLGGWIGVDPDNYPPDRRRTRLLAAPELHRKRGTSPGITRALDVATNGLCSRGAIIVIEDFRLRHIFATILGADLSIKDDPLLPGYSPASNSIVGDTLFLGDPRVQAELQALFVEDLGIPGGAQAAEALYDRLAHRITVFIHDQVEKVDINLVRRIVEAEKPAHVQATIRRASQPFMIGLASLLGVNTYLGPDVPRGTATLGKSQIGRYDVITHLPTLDPRLENSRSYEEYDKPVARLRGPEAIAPGQPIVLDGIASTAPSGTSISSYEWRLLPS